MAGATSQVKLFMPNYAEHKYPNRTKVTDLKRRSALGQIARNQTIEQRMAGRTDTNDASGCHIWRGAITWQGYGQLWWNGKMRRAHQVAWMLAGNELPQEPYVLHHVCHNTLCVNVAHLQRVTRYENAVNLSNSVWGQNKRKTECKRGHPFTPENTIVGTRKGFETRQCRACRAMYPLKKTA